LSTLTKVLIILLAFSTFLVCGVVVTYVATAENYKEMYENRRAEIQSLRESNSDIKVRLNETIEKMDAQKQGLRDQIASLENKYSGLQTQYETIKRDRDALVQKVNDWTSIIDGFRKTNEELGQILDKKLDELDKVQAEKIKIEKELTETSNTLVAKMAVIDSLETKNRRLTEEKESLQEGLNLDLRQSGKVVAAAEPVTPAEGPKAKGASPMQAQVKKIDLQGKVTEIDESNNLVSISVGKADGVKTGMRFYVIRGDDFICELEIIDVDVEESLGLMQLVQQQPQQGDKVTTNL